MCFHVIRIKKYFFISIFQTAIFLFIIRHNYKIYLYKKGIICIFILFLYSLDLGKLNFLFRINFTKTDYFQRVELLKKI